MEAPQVLTADSFMIAWRMFPVYRIRAFRKTYDLADDDPKAKQLAERVVDKGVRVFDKRIAARAAKTTPTKSLEETMRDGDGRESDDQDAEIGQ